MLHGSHRLARLSEFVISFAADTGVKEVKQQSSSTLGGRHKPLTNHRYFPAFRNGGHPS